MLKIKNKSLDMLVTPNHNLVTSIGNWSDIEFGIHKAEDVYQRQLHFKTTSFNDVPDVEYFTLPAIENRNKGFYIDNPPEIKIPMDDFLKKMDLEHQLTNLICNIMVFI